MAMSDGSDLSIDDVLGRFCVVVDDEAREVGTRFLDGYRLVEPRIHTRDDDSGCSLVHAGVVIGGLEGTASRVVNPVCSMASWSDRGKHI